MSKEQQLINKIKNKYLLLRGIEITLFALGVACMVFAITHYFVSPAIAWTAALITGVTTVATLFFRLNLYGFTESRITTYLNHHYPQLEASTDLLLNNDPLSTLQHLQKSTVYQKLQSIEDTIRFPHRLLLASLVLVTGILAGYVAMQLKTIHSAAGSVRENTLGGDADNKENPVITALSKTTVTVTPPAYTQKATITSSSLSLKVIEGSTVKWNFTFDGPPPRLSMIFSGKDSVQFTTPSGNSFTYQRTFTESGFYQYVWKDQSGADHPSDYYPIEIIKDEAPRIAVDHLAQFVELKLTDRLVIDLKATLSDDFGLSDSHIIATVSKGSGESVKFREETLRFTSPSVITGKVQQATRAIDLLKLGLEPGDELYFYIEAMDNKTPLANKARTETFFIALQDTASYEMVEDAGLGVDLMPEYFRSQRQIIMDSEKLLEDRKVKKISKEDFNSKSNELGYDQKVLRLRYGQFMGEEAESGIGIQSTPPDEDHDEKIEDVAKKFGHTHDTENEHNLVADKKSTAPAEKQHDHDHTEKEGDEKNPMAAFMHNHDSEEEATFFQQSVKTKLKAALTLMWDAELYLRMYQPDKSLPYQYKILKLLKEISNDSRVYVHRSGFDAPPLKEEKRLSGDLAEVKNSFNSNKSTTAISYPAIREALTTIESLLLKKNPVLTSSEQTILQKAGNELAGVAIAQPGVYIKSLSALKSILTNEVAPENRKASLITIRNSFWKVLPPEATSPSATRNTLHPFDQQFLKQLEKGKP